MKKYRFIQFLNSLQKSEYGKILFFILDLPFYLSILALITKIFASISEYLAGSIGVKIDPTAWIISMLLPAAFFMNLVVHPFVLKVTEKMVGRRLERRWLFHPIHVLSLFLINLPMLKKYKDLTRESQDSWKLFKEMLPELNTDWDWGTFEYYGPLSARMFNVLDSLLFKYAEQETRDKKFWKIYDFIGALDYKKCLYKKKSQYILFQKLHNEITPSNGLDIVQKLYGGYAATADRVSEYRTWILFLEDKRKFRTSSSISIIYTSIETAFWPRMQRVKEIQEAFLLKLGEELWKEYLEAPSCGGLALTNADRSEAWLTKVNNSNATATMAEALRQIADTFGEFSPNIFKRSDSVVIPRPTEIIPVNITLSNGQKISFRQYCILLSKGGAK